MQVQTTSSTSTAPPPPLPSIKNYGKLLQHAIKTTNLVDIERALSGYKEQQNKAHALAIKKIEEMAAAKKTSPEKAIKALILETDLLVKKLPNGELPLIFAVQEKNFHVVEFLMKKGADPSLKDNRKFSALFCARHLNPTLSAILASHYYSEEFSQLKEIFSDPKVMQQATEALSTIKGDINILNKTVQSLVFSLNRKTPHASSTAPATNAPALAANAPGPANSNEPKKITPEDVLKVMYGLVNVANLTEIKKAVEIIKESEFHFVVANCDCETIKVYLSVLEDKTVLDKPNAHGFRPIHYALALGHFDIAKLLLEHGAHMDFDNVLSATALIGTPDSEEHPSKISKLDMLYFVSTLLMWSSKVLVEAHLSNDQKTENNKLELLGKACLGLHFVASIYTTTRLYGGIHPLLYAFFMAYKSLLFGFDHPVNSCIKIYEIAGFSLKAFWTFSGVLRNSAYGRGRALLKAAVVGLPNLHIAIHRIKHFALDPWLQNSSNAQSTQPVEQLAPAKESSIRWPPTTAGARLARLLKGPPELPQQAPAPSEAPKTGYSAFLPPALGFSSYFTKI